MVSYLTEELVAEGHDLTLFASGDSVTAARLVERALGLDNRCRDAMAAHFRMFGLVTDLASQFDLIHFHIDYLHFPLTQRQAWPHLTTLHGRLDLPKLRPLYRQFPGQPLVSISDAQRAPRHGTHFAEEKAGSSRK